MKTDRDIAPNATGNEPVQVTVLTEPMFVTDARGRVVYLDLAALAFPDPAPEAEADVDDDEGVVLTGATRFHHR